MIAGELKLSSVLLSRSELPSGWKEQMFALLSSCFEGVTREVFEADLREKNWVILLLRADEVAGFSTIHAYETVYKGELLNIIYSGDTIVSPDSWGSPALPRSWITGVNNILRGMAGSRSFWLLLSSGFRTYRFLPVFWKSFYPTCKQSTPPVFADLLHSLATERFGSTFHSGVVRFPAPQRLRQDLLEIPLARLQDPHVAFFIRQNPGHTNGDELVCLTELHPDNLTRAGIRMVRSDEL